MLAALQEELSLSTSQFAITIVKTTEERRDVFRLRHQVYCVERGHHNLPGDTGEEFDDFDSHSEHVLLRDGEHGEPVGTARLICFDPANPGASFQVQEFCPPDHLAHLPLRTTAEISRFALSKTRRMGCANMALMRLALVRGLVQLSSKLGITHWLALQERTLIRLNERDAIRFDPLGPPVICHGIRYPTAVDLAKMLDGVRREQLSTWDYLTAGGTWFGRARWMAGPTSDRGCTARENLEMGSLG